MVEDLIGMPCGPHFEQQLRLESNDLKIVVQCSTLLADGLKRVRAKMQEIQGEWDQVIMSIKEARMNHRAEQREKESFVSLSVASTRLSPIVFASLDVTINTLGILFSREHDVVNSLNSSIASAAKQFQQQYQICTQNESKYATELQQYEQIVQTYLQQLWSSKQSDDGTTRSASKGLTSYFSPMKKSTAVKDIKAVSGMDVVCQQYTMEKKRLQIAEQCQLFSPIAVINACDSVYKCMQLSLSGLERSVIASCEEVNTTIEQVRHNNIMKLYELEVSSTVSDIKSVQTDEYFAQKIKKFSGNTDAVDGSLVVDPLDMSDLDVEMYDPAVLKQGYVWMSLNQINWQRVWLILESSVLYALLRSTETSSYDKFVISENLQLCGLQEMLTLDSSRTKSTASSSSSATATASTAKRALLSVSSPISNLFIIRIASDDIGVVIQTETYQDCLLWTKSIRSAIEKSYLSADSQSVPAVIPRCSAAKSVKSDSSEAADVGDAAGSASLSTAGVCASGPTAPEDIEAVDNYTAAKDAIEAQAEDVNSALIANILAKNEFCADCRRPHPDWVSINLCVVVCIECVGVHRSLGTHISKVRSLRLDVLDYEIYQLISKTGNAIANAVWEYSLESSSFTKPTPLSVTKEREEFIKAKYVEKRFIDKSLSTNTSVDDEFESFVKNNKIMSSLFAAVKEDNIEQVLYLIAAGAELDDLFSYSWTSAGGSSDDGTAGTVAYSLQCTALHVAALNDALLSTVLLVTGGACVDVCMHCPDRVCEALGIDIDQFRDSDPINFQTESATSRDNPAVDALTAVSSATCASTFGASNVTAYIIADGLGHEEIATYLSQKSKNNDGWKFGTKDSIEKIGHSSSKGWFPGKYLGFKGAGNGSGNGTALLGQGKQKVSASASGQISRSASMSDAISPQIRRKSSSNSFSFNKLLSPSSADEEDEQGMGQGQGQGQAQDASSDEKRVQSNSDAERIESSSFSPSDGRSISTKLVNRSVSMSASPLTSSNSSKESTPSTWYIGKYIGRQKRASHTT